MRTKRDSSLRLAPNLELPLEAVTQTFAILAKRGAGKTNTATVMVEEMVAASLPVVYPLREPRLARRA